MRRVRVAKICLGEVNLEPEVAHHVRDVLRLGRSEPVEIFDAEGGMGAGVIASVDAGEVRVRIDEIRPQAQRPGRLIVAAAVPKGHRADWLIEKLSEVGTDAYIPLAAERSVVKPQGLAKFARWKRLAEESARQCQRRGVMQIEAMMTPVELIERSSRQGMAMWVMSTARDARPIANQLSALPRSLALLIGPEGDWTPRELHDFERAGAIALKLTESILRVETAAIVAAGIVSAAMADASRFEAPTRQTGG